jgi:hypothetical protein
MMIAKAHKELGFTALGHRRKLLDAIAGLGAEPSPQGLFSDLKTAPAAQSASWFVPLLWSPFPDERTKKANSKNSPPIDWALSAVSACETD